MISYQEEIPIDFTGTLTVQATRRGSPYGSPVSQKVSAHLALGEKPKLESKYSQYYTAGGDQGLSDGLLGSLDFRDGRWQGYFGAHFVGIIDLKNEQSISEVSANFYQYTNAWIFFPLEVVIEYSQDGIQWESFGTQSPSTKPNERGKFIETLGFKSDQPIQARYIKFTATNILHVPDWHEAAGSKAWIFIDEIIIR